MDWFKGTFILQDTMDLPNKKVSILQVFRSTDYWIKCIHRSFQPTTAGKRLVLVELLLAEEVVELLPECSPRQKAISYPCNSWLVFWVKMALEYHRILLVRILLVLDDASYQRNMRNLLLLQAFSGKTQNISTQFQSLFEPNIYGLPVAPCCSVGSFSQQLGSWTRLLYPIQFDVMEVAGVLPR